MPQTNRCCVTGYVVAAIAVAAVALTLLGACGAGHAPAATPRGHAGGDLVAVPDTASIGQTIALHGTDWQNELVSFGVFVEDTNYPSNFLNTYAGHAYSSLATLGATANFALTYVIPDFILYGNGKSVAISPGTRLVFFTSEQGNAHTGPTVSIVAK
jgi:hypothetical protein